MDELKIFTDGTDTVIALSPEDAVRVWNEHVGDDYVENGYGEVNEWELVTDEMFQIYQEEAPEQIDIPEGATVLFKDDDKPYGPFLITAASAAWIKQHGRGFLCSTEW